ncbi:MAG: hypothetical protein M1457_13980 [bacterium]|nr:hypothetical protein [bacterium]
MTDLDQSLCEKREHLFPDVLFDPHGVRSMTHAVALVLIREVPIPLSDRINAAGDDFAYREDRVFSSATRT